MSSDPRGQVLRSLQKIVRGRYAERHDERDEIGRRAAGGGIRPWLASCDHQALARAHPPLSRWAGVGAGRTALR